MAIFSAATILETKELVDGYGFRLPLNSDMIHKVGQWMANERLCCPFFTFKMIVSEELWIELSGTEAVKSLIESDVVGLIRSRDFPTMDVLQATYEAVTGTG
ncbi:MAG: hypothetical protein R3E39_12100 [Anaerolineae bacterium]